DHLAVRIEAGGGTVKRLIQHAAIAALIAVPAILPAQGVASSFDRTKAPPVASAPVFRVPTWTVDTLPNGARLVVVEKHDLPLVSFSIHFEGGSLQTNAKQGVATFVGAMMREGTATRTGDQINDELALLGTNVGFGIGTESGSASFSSLAR